MKKLILIATFALLALAAGAQSMTEEQFEAKAQKLYSEAGELAAQGKSKQAEGMYNQLVRDFKKLPAQTQKDTQGFLGSLYYNIACMRSLGKETKGAVDAFALALDYGWSDYLHAQKDTDLDYVRGDKRFRELMEGMIEKYDYLNTLRKAAAYRTQDATALPRFTYMAPDDANLVKLRRTYNLDSIAGSGDELSKIKNLLTWVHNTVRHDGNSDNPAQKNAIALIELCKKEDRGVNCRMLGQILNECYLAMGFKSRYVTCMPKVYINDCHVINTVYSNTLGKWLWVDPTQNAWVTDENGTMLGIGEVRERLRTGETLVLNEEANWNNQEKTTKEYYLDYYMAKNLYYVECAVHSLYDGETSREGKPRPVYVDLLPPGFTADPYHAGQVATTDDKYFWESPYGKWPEI